MPSITPEDAVVAAAHQLTLALQGNSIGEPRHLEELKQVAKVFEDIASKKASKAAENTITNNGIQLLPQEEIPTIEEPIPRVDKAPNQEEYSTEDPSPRVPNAPQLIVAYPSDAVVPTREDSSSSIPNYISQDDEQIPTYNTRSRRAITRSITQEALLSTMEVTTSRPSAKNLASKKFPLQLLCEFAGAVMDSNGELLQYRHLMARKEYREVWGNGYAKELGRLAQGLDGVVEGTNTLEFIRKEDVPKDRFKDTTYGQIVGNYRPEKEDPNRARLVVGGDRINYPGEVGTPTADMLTVKLLLNSIVSTPLAIFFHCGHQVFLPHDTPQAF